MNAWRLDSLWMWLLGLVAAAVLGSAVLDIGAATAGGVARALAGAASIGAHADARAAQTRALACLP